MKDGGADEVFAGSSSDRRGVPGRLRLQTERPRRARPSLTAHRGCASNPGHDAGRSASDSRRAGLEDQWDTRARDAGPVPVACGAAQDRRV